jgi:spore coat polysaccharide biosynthesis predicted glycosyltransferase SpsG
MGCVVITRVELVADSGHQVGLGHVARLAALAEELGPTAVFAVTDNDARRWLEVRGFPVASARTAAEVVVLDRLNPVDVDEVLGLQAGGALVVLMDDTGPGRAVADVVIDPPTLADWPPAAGRKLQGFEHTLLRREWAAARSVPAVRDGVLLTFGGTDPYGLSSLAADALAGMDLPVTTVLGTTSGVDVAGTVLRSPPDFASRVRGARLLVTAFGGTVLEAACVGTPVISVCTREDHFLHAEALALHGTLRVVDGRDGVTGVTLRTHVENALRDADWLASAARRGPALIDGLGARRVAAVLLASVRSPGSAQHDAKGL